MAILISFLLGLVSGALYNEHIYRQSLSFPESRPILGFTLRLGITAVVGIFVAVVFGSNGLLAFAGGNLLGRLIHTAVRGLLVVRY